MAASTQTKGQAMLANEVQAQLQGEVVQAVQAALPPVHTQLAQALAKHGYAGPDEQGYVPDEVAWLVAAAADEFMVGLLQTLGYVTDEAAAITEEGPTLALHAALRP